MFRIYLDNNASAPVLPAVAEAMVPFLSDFPGNPASSHFAGRQARKALEDAREKTATLLQARPDEVIFTSGATEANNLALFGLLGAIKKPDGERRILISAIEHPCVNEPVNDLRQSGLSVGLLPVDSSCRIDLAALREMLCTNTRLVSVMMANHETGALQPIEEIKGCLADDVHFHCDAAAAAGKIPIHFRDLGFTSLTISGHKFHGPPGIGALVLRAGTKLRPRTLGGHQQQGRRPGTEPVALAVGLTTALELAVTEMAQRHNTVLALRQLFLETIRSRAAPVVLNGPQENGIPHTLNLSFPGCQADILLMNLDLAGIACSTGSACSSGSLLPSPVLRAMNVTDEVLHSAMRFSLSHLLDDQAVKAAAERVAEVVVRLRR